VNECEYNKRSLGWVRVRMKGFRVTRVESIVITTKGIETFETHDNTLPSRSVDGRNDLHDPQQRLEGSWGQLTGWNQRDMEEVE